MRPLVPSCLSISLHGTDRMASTNSREISYLGILLTFVDIFRSLLKSSKNNRHCTWRPAYVYVNGLYNVGRLFCMRYALRPKLNWRLYILPCIGHVKEIAYLALYEISTGITVWRPLRKKGRKPDISSFTKEVKEITSRRLRDRGKEWIIAREAEERVDDPNIIQRPTRKKVYEYSDCV
jgi:hypothetical protein